MGALLLRAAAVAPPSHPVACVRACSDEQRMSSTGIDIGFMLFILLQQLVEAKVIPSSAVVPNGAVVNPYQLKKMGAAKVRGAGRGRGDQAREC